MNSHQQPHQDISTAVEWLESAERITIFSGAGISAASGISTFRDESGFWKRFPPDQYANWKGLIQTALLQPTQLAEFFTEILEPIANAEPNLAHQAVSELAIHKDVQVITQNIDRLHQAAGSENVYEVHGSLFEIVSHPGGSLIHTMSRDELKSVVDQLQASQHQAWKTAGLLKAVAPLFGISWSRIHRPNIVLFGDQLAEPAWSHAETAAMDCDLMISIGTSQSVYPAAGLPFTAQEHGAKLIVIDPQAGGGDLWLADQAETLLPRLVKLAFGDGAANNG